MMANFQILSHSSESSISGSLMVLIIRVNFGDLTVKFLLNSITDPKDGQFAKSCHTPPNHHFQLASKVSIKIEVASRFE